MERFRTQSEGVVKISTSCWYVSRLKSMGPIDSPASSSSKVMLEVNMFDRPLASTGQVPLFPITIATTLSTREYPGCTAFKNSVIQNLVSILIYYVHCNYNIPCFFPSTFTKATSTFSNPHSSRTAFTWDRENGWQITVVVKLILPTVVFIDLTLLTTPLNVEVFICIVLQNNTTY